MTIPLPCPISGSAMSSEVTSRPLLLLVEDESNLRRLAREYLELQGYNVLEAAKGALEKATSVAEARAAHTATLDGLTDPPKPAEPIEPLPELGWLPVTFPFPGGTEPMVFGLTDGAEMCHWQR